MYELVAEVLNGNNSIIGYEVSNLDPIVTNRKLSKLLTQDIMKLINTGMVTNGRIENNHIVTSHQLMEYEYTKYVQDDNTVFIGSDLDEHMKTYLRALIKQLEPHMARSNTEFMGIDYDLEYSHNIRKHIIKAVFKARNNTYVVYNISKAAVYLKERNDYVYRYNLNVDMFSGNNKNKLYSRTDIKVECLKELHESLQIVLKTI